MDDGELGAKSKQIKEESKFRNRDIEQLKTVL